MLVCSIAFLEGCMPFASYIKFSIPDTCFSSFLRFTYGLFLAKFTPCLQVLSLWWIQDLIPMAHSFLLPQWRLAGKLFCHELKLLYQPSVSRQSMVWTTFFFFFSFGSNQNPMGAYLGRGDGGVGNQIYVQQDPLGLKFKGSTIYLDQWWVLGSRNIILINS